MVLLLNKCYPINGLAAWHNKKRCLIYREVPSGKHFGYCGKGRCISNKRAKRILKLVDSADGHSCADTLIEI